MPATPRALDLAQRAARAADDKRATDIVALDVSGQFPLSDVFLIVSADNERQVGAVVDAVEDDLREHGTKALRREGEREGRWVLLDFGDIIVHVLHEDERDFYQLERLWKDCPAITLDLEQTGEAASTPAVTDGAAEAPESDTASDPQGEEPEARQ